MLSALQFGLVSLGTAILLAGVWIVSIKANGSDKKMSTSTSVDEMDRLLCDEPESFESDTEGSDEEPGASRGALCPALLIRSTLGQWSGFLAG